MSAALMVPSVLLAAICHVIQNLLGIVCLVHWQAAEVSSLVMT